MGLSISGKNKKFFFILLLFTFLLKISLAFYFSYLGNCNHSELAVGYLAKETGDTFSYLGPIDNFIKDGNYYFWNGIRNVYAGRMPYYGVPYFLLRLFFDKPLASDLVVLLQILFDTLATVYFARWCFETFKSQTGFWLGYFLYFAGFNYFENSLLLNTETFSLSFTVLFYYFFNRYWNGAKDLSPYYANFWLSLALLQRPNLAPIYIVFLGIYLYREKLYKPEHFREFFRRMVWFALPLVISITPWVVRNIIVLHQPIITQESITAGYNYSEAEFAFRRYVFAWGGDATYWDPTSAACYFKLNPPVKCTFNSLPDYSLAEGYNRQDVEDARQAYLEFQQNSSPELEQKVIDKFDRLTAIYISERPFMYYVGSGIVRTKTMFWHTNNYNLPINPENPCFKSFQLIFKVIQAITYQLTLFFGTIMMLTLVYKKRISLLFLFVPIYLIILFNFIVKVVEARYFNHAYPILLLGLVAFFLLIYSKIKNLFADKKSDSYNKLT